MSITGRWPQWMLKETLGGLLDDDFWSVPVRGVSVSAGKLEIDMPGVKRENVSVKVLGNHLYVSWKDRRGGDQQNTFYIGKSSNVQSKLADGILTITFDNSSNEAVEIEVK